MAIIMDFKEYKAFKEEVVVLSSRQGSLLGSLSQFVSYVISNVCLIN